MKEPETGALLGRFMERLDLYPMITGPGHRILAVSGRLLERLGFTKDEFAGVSPIKLLGIEAFQDIFVRRTDWSRPLKNYRAFLRSANGEKPLFQISAFQERDPASGEPRLCLLLQEIPLSPGMHVDLGDYEASVRANQIIKKYISRHLAHRARSASAAGYDYIPNEERELTFLFADLVSYTAIAEKQSPDAILEMLNTSIGATSATILHSGGFVDKIMGDSIFAVFEKPLSALIAGIEMQKQFNLLNLFRLKSGEPEIAIRVGVHTGPCIVGSIGAEEFYELTFIGDAVNTASRLERAARAGAILVSQSTADLVGDQADYLETIELSAKGKSRTIRAHYLNRISFASEKGQITLGLDDHIF